MKSTPDMLMELVQYDDFVLHANAMIGSKLEWLDMGKYKKIQKVPSPLGELEYIPKNQSWNGHIWLIWRGGKLTVQLHYQTQKVERIAMEMGKWSWILQPRRIELVIGIWSTLESFTQTITAFARRILELEWKSNTDKK